LDIGFERAGFNILFSTDIDPICCETMRTNLGKTLSKNAVVHECDVKNLDLNSLPPNIDVVIGGPPCQSFSASGRRAGGAAGRLDQRGNLFEWYCKVLEKVQPEVFLFENVRGILTTNKGKDFEEIIKAFKKLGYEINYRVLDAEDYGVPQQRERVFIVGHKKSMTFLFPRPVYGPDSHANIPYISVGEAIGDLKLSDEDIKDTKLDSGKYSELVPLVPPGENYLHFTEKRGCSNPIFAYRSRFSDFLYKANPNIPVKTIIASPGKYTGPIHWENRGLTVNEYKRIQGFPDEHYFVGNRQDKIRQIGNSVCPVIAYYLALAIRKQFFQKDVNIELLPHDYKLSFDSRKGERARLTKKRHDSSNASTQSKSFFKLEDYVEQIKIAKSSNSTIDCRASKENVFLTVKHRDSTKHQIHMEMEIQNGNGESSEILLMVDLYSSDDEGIQHMWNAVDSWVRKCSTFYSLSELYGHFTEPHPIFRIITFDIYENTPLLRFARYCSDFKNCSMYHDRSHLLELFYDGADLENFIDIVKRLRSFRYDIRCHETNVAIHKSLYMIAYPFSLPPSKQMNFSIKEI